MKNNLLAAIILVCIALVISLILIKRNDDAQQQSDASAIADYSNQLSSAQTTIAIREGTIAVFSNNLDECASAGAVLSNQLSEARSAIVLDTQQITNLSGQVAEVTSENQTLEAQVVVLTNQVADLAGQIAATKANLEQANKEYALLEDRLRRDVAERLVVQREFDNPVELQAQLKKLRKNPAEAISAEDIYSGLDVEVNSNGSFHVVSPN